MPEGGKDEETHAHPEGADDEEGPSAKFLDEDETGEGADEVHGAEDDLRDERVHARSAENDGAVVEEEIRARQLLEGHEC